MEFISVRMRTPEQFWNDVKKHGGIVKVKENNYMKASEARKISEDTTSKAVQNLRFLVDTKVQEAAKKHNFSVDVYVGEFNNNVLNLVKKSLEDDGFTVSYKRSYDMRDGNYSTMTVKW